MANNEDKNPKKVLIITYYWPPGGGGGVQRWLKFVKYLPEYGIQPVVAIPDNPEYPVKDDSLLKDISPDLEVIRIPIWEPYKLFKLFTGKKQDENVNSGLLSKGEKKSFTEKLSIWIRGNLLIPDPRVFWVRQANKQLAKYLKTSDIKSVITTGPPHSVHLIGLKLKKKLKIKWLADFRDPWSEIDYLEEFNPTFIARSIQKKLEKKVLTNADEVITVSNNWAKDLERLGAKSTTVITNGYDSEDFSSFNYNYKPDNFVMLYSGILHDYRNPEYLWNGIEELLNSSKEFEEKFRLQLFGTIDQKVIDYLDKLPKLSRLYHNGGYIPHNRLIKEYENASMLLLLQNDTKNALGHIPGKLFEYLAARKFILAIGPEGSDVSRVIDETNSGNLFPFKDYSGIIDCINYIFSVKSIRENSKNIYSFSRENLTLKLSILI